MTLRVILQIVPFGDETAIREIGRLDIFNKGTFCDFDGLVYEYGIIEMTPKSGALHDETVLHRREHGAWQLVWKALNDLKLNGPD
jgi:hypothetical protein